MKFVFCFSFFTNTISFSGAANIVSNAAVTTLQLFAPKSSKKSAGLFLDVLKVGGIFDLQGAVTVTKEGKSSNIWVVLTPVNSQLGFYLNKGDVGQGRTKRLSKIQLLQYDKAERIETRVFLFGRKSIKSAVDIILEFSDKEEAKIWETSLISCIAMGAKRERHNKRVVYDQYIQMCKSLSDLMVTLLDSVAWKNYL
jgi:hypothetical protein